MCLCAYQCMYILSGLVSKNSVLLCHMNVYVGGGAVGQSSFMGVCEERNSWQAALLEQKSANDGCDRKDEHAGLKIKT